MIKRTAAKVIKELKSGYPTITITGPRQSGKTTLSKALFPDRPYVSFEDPDIRLRAESDPRSFLRKYHDGAIFDEVQRFPELLSYLQQIIDEGPHHCRFVLTGSQQFGLMSKITQSLAGRTALINLLPFSIHELYPSSKKPDLDALLVTGLYPPIHDRKLDPAKWYAQYVSTYVERDIRQIINIKDLGQFQRFLKLCAARCGGLINFSSLASDTGISNTTIKQWLSVLEASYIVFFLQPHFVNYGKRVVKTPKLYFYDSGLACYLLSITSPEQLNISPMRGQLFESFIISEAMKNAYNKAHRANTYFWRDKRGMEVDLLIDDGLYYSGIEIKSGSTFHPEFLKNLKQWKKIAKGHKTDTMLIYGGGESFHFHDIPVYHWSDHRWIDKI